MTVNNNQENPYIPRELIRDVCSSLLRGDLIDSDVLTANDKERYLRTRFVCVCTVLGLYFPTSKTAALAHFLPSEDLENVCQQLICNLNEKGIAETPQYFLEEGPQSIFKELFGEERHKALRNPAYISKHFPAAQPLLTILRDRLPPNTDSIDVMIDKQTGIVHLYDGTLRTLRRPKTRDFEVERR